MINLVAQVIFGKPVEPGTPAVSVKVVKLWESRHVLGPIGPLGPPEELDNYPPG